MPRRKLGALVLIFAACASGCGKKPGRDKAIPAARDSGIALPSLDGLGLTKVGSPADGAPGAEKWLRKVTVDVPAEGSPKVSDARDASQWRGIAFEMGCTPIPLKSPAKLFVKLDAGGDVTVGGTACKGLGDLRRLVAEATHRHPETNVVIDASPDVPYGTFLRVITVLIDTTGRIEFHVPEGRWLTIDLSQVRARLKAEIDRKDFDKHGCPKACIRIRARASVPYRAVLGVMVGALREYIWRVSFIGVLCDREVEIGPTYGASGEPRDFTAGFYDPALEEEIRGMGLEQPVFVHEELEPEEATADVPAGRPKRPPLRGGVARRTNPAVDLAVEWLARHQEPDGRWDAAKSGGAEGMDVAATGLALFALLGAGHTEKHGRYSPAVTRAVEWITKQQTANGRIGKNPKMAGLQHAICGLALSEAYAMAGVPETGAAAQKAVDYSVFGHQRKMAGWGNVPKGDPDMATMGWFIAQLKSAHRARLQVGPPRKPGVTIHIDRSPEDIPRLRGFIDAIRWLDEVTDRASLRLGAERSPFATALAMVSRQFMGWKRTQPLPGGADYLVRHLPEWREGNVDFHYWYWGTLAMFQMGDERWKAWSAAFRNMVAEHQRTDADFAGSWDPKGKLCEEGGRVCSTALAAMALEVYYRWLPLYK